jgi:hypothetical protein
MPYITRKRIKKVNTKNSFYLKIDLEDDDTWEKYDQFFDPNFSFLIRGKVRFVSNNEDEIIHEEFKKDYDFPIFSLKKYNYQTEKWYYEFRVLIIPEDLVNGFNISGGMGIEVSLIKFIKGKDIFGNEPIPFWYNADLDTRIIPDTDFVDKNKDFEVKGSKDELSSSEDLILTKFTDSFYVSLVDEINTTFKKKLWTSTMVLLRKLFENLLIEMFREKYISDPEKVNLFYNKKEHQFRSFESLKNSLFDKDNLIDFEPYDPMIYKDRNFKGFLEKIKIEGNKNAHTMEIIHNPEKIKVMRDAINEYSALLCRIINRINRNNVV